MSRANNLTVSDQWSAIRREDDGDTFVAAVLNIPAKDMKVILTCENREDPKDKKEAKILAVANLYAGRAPPPKVYAMLEGKLPDSEPSLSSVVHEPSMVREEECRNAVRGDSGSRASFDPQTRYKS